MAEDKKGLLTIILGKAKPTPKGAEEPADGEAEGSDDEGAKAAAEELLTAIEKKDADAVVEAFKALRDCCGED